MSLNPSPQRRPIRLDAPGDALGFLPTPVRLHMRFLRVGSGWTWLVMAPAGKAPMTVNWMKGHVTDRIDVATGIAPRVLRCHLAEAPVSWTRWLACGIVLQLDLSPEGTATLFVQATPAELSGLADALGLSPSVVRDRALNLEPLEATPLTARQLEVLRNAVAMGYYDVPHRIDLRRLGKAMGLSVSAVSQLLRRAQSQVIRGYVDGNLLERGQRLTDFEDDLQGPPKGA